MEKLSLLEKLKTLNQWQLQQQLHFAKLKSDIESGADNGTDNGADNGTDNGANKHNKEIESEPFANKENWITHGDYKVNSFTKTMGRNALTNALRSIDLNSSTNEFQSAESLTVEDENEGPEESLQNWHLSGLQTVKFISSSDSNVDIENYGQVNPLQDTDSEGFSDCEILNFDNDDGVKPFSETDDEEMIDHERVYKGYSSTRMYYSNRENIDGKDSKFSTQDFLPQAVNRNIKPPKPNHEAAFSDQYSDRSDESNEEDEEENEYDDGKETTVLHVDIANDSPVQKEVNIDDKPVKSKLNDSGITFDKMIEEEMENDVESALNTSTPMKKKKHRFLKRGEGLKRFDRGNNAHIPKNEKPNLKKTQDTQRTNLKNTAFDIKLPSLPVQQQKQAKTKPGLPLKLNLKRVKQNILPPPNVPIKYPQKENTRQIESVDKELMHNAVFARKQLPYQDSINPKYFSATDKPDVQQSISSAILEASFQKMMSHYREKEEREDKELDDFEALEEAAENMSLSSNSSLVVKLLGKKKGGERKEKLNQLDEISEKQPLLEGEIDKQNAVQRPPSYDFEDESSWSDHTHSDTSIFSVEENEETMIRDESPSPDMPPMKRIVSKRKDGDQSKNLSQENCSELIENTNEDLQQPSAISSTVKKKLAELENEIKTFRSENEKLEKLRRERETEVARLRKEIHTFQSERKADTERFEAYKIEEIKKLKAEKKAFDKYQKAARTFPNKQEREELKESKEEIKKLNDELKTRETRWNNASHRFRTRIADLEEENKELRQEIKAFEAERLERWKRGKVEKNQTTPKESLSDERIANEEPTKDIHLNMSPPVPLSKFSEPHPQNIQSLSPRSPLEASRSTKELKSPTDKREISSRGEFGHKDGKTEMIMPDSSKLITFPNGTKKTISPDGKVVSVCFFNGDIKRLLPDDSIVYYYAKTQTTHTTQSDGLEVLEFSNKQIEKRHPDGRTEVIFPDQTVKFLYPDGSEETVFTDGTVQNINTTGVRTIVFPNGQRETHTKQFKRREYPNGTVKTVYEDGRQETKYSNGRLRVKDKHGNLLLDSGLNQT